MSFLTRAFVTATVERAVKTFAQSLAALLAASGAGLLAVPWLTTLSVAGTAAVVSVLSSVASSGVGHPGPSLASEGVEAAPAAVPAVARAA
ncbi:holin [Angustibacter aerolatus]